MNDQERTAVTTPSPPPSDREETQPRASVGPIIPPAAEVPSELRAESEAGHGASDELKLMSTNQLIALYTEYRETQEDMLSESGGFAKLLARRDERLVESFAKTIEHLVEPRFSGIELKLSKQGEMIHKLEKECAELRQEHRETARKIEVFERELAQLKEQRGAGEAAATSAG
jgi:uncharacterized coiled-coil protein SlyX